jgi:hypothetical protein
MSGLAITDRIVRVCRNHAKPRRYPAERMELRVSTSSTVPAISTSESLADRAGVCASAFLARGEVVTVASTRV